jgi:hypothetical protein
MWTAPLRLVVGKNDLRGKFGLADQRLVSIRLSEEAAQHFGWIGKFFGMDWTGLLPGHRHGHGSAGSQGSPVPRLSRRPN